MPTMKGAENRGSMNLAVWEDSAGIARSAF
jgi:hypothetical protein